MGWSFIQLESLIFLIRIKTFGELKFWSSLHRGWSISLAKLRTTHTAIFLHLRSIRCLLMFSDDMTKKNQRFILINEHIMCSHSFKGDDARSCSWMSFAFFVASSKTFVRIHCHSTSLTSKKPQLSENCYPRAEQCKKLKQSIHVSIFKWNLENVSFSSMTYDSIAKSEISQNSQRLRQLTLWITLFRSNNGTVSL